MSPIKYRLLVLSIISYSSTFSGGLGVSAIRDDSMQAAYNEFAILTTDLSKSLTKTLTTVTVQTFDNIKSMNESMLAQIGVTILLTNDTINHMIDTVKQAGASDVQFCEGYAWKNLQYYETSISRTWIDCANYMMDFVIYQNEQMLDYAYSIEGTLRGCASRDIAQCTKHGIEGSCDEFVIANIEEAKTKVTNSFHLLNVTGVNQLMLDYNLAPCYRLVQDELTSYPQMILQYMGNCVGEQSRKAVPYSC